MQIKPQKIATFSSFGFVIDINEDLYCWQLHEYPITISKVFEEEGMLFRSIVVSGNSIVLLDVNNYIWRFKYTYGRLDKIGDMKKKFKKSDCPLEWDVQSIGLTSWNNEYILSIFTSDGKIYSELEGEVKELDNLPPFTYFYSGTHSICAGVDFQGDIWYWYVKGEKKPNKIPTNGEPLDMIIEEFSIKYIDSEGSMWKYNTRDDIHEKLFPNQNLPPFHNLYGAGRHGFALSQKDELYGWGNNSSMQLGIKHGFVPVPTQIPTDRFWTCIYCAYDNYSILIAEDGELFSWGRNSSVHIQGIICRKKMLQKSARK